MTTSRRGEGYLSIRIRGIIAGDALVGANALAGFDLDLAVLTDGLAGSAYGDAVVILGR